MPQKLEVSFRATRTPTPDLDLSDPVQIRAWLERQIDTDVQLDGRLKDQIAIFTPEGVIGGAVAGAVELGQEEALVALLRNMGGPSVAARFRITEVMVPGPEGQPLRAVAMVQLWADRSDWRAEVRRFGETVDRVGRWLSDWQELSGTGPDDAPDWLRELVDPGKYTFGDATLTGTQTPRPPVLRPRFLPPVPRPLSDDPRVFLYSLHMALDKELLAHGLDHFIVFVARPDRLDRWDIQDFGSFSLDHVVAAICQSAPGDTVAIVHPGVVHLRDGRSLRGFISLCERGPWLGRRSLALDLSGPEPVAPQPANYQELEAVETSWFTMETPLKLSARSREPEA